MVARLPRATHAGLVCSLVAALVACSVSSPTISPSEAASGAAIPTAHVIQPPNADATYEAVFLRLEVADGASEVLVIGVNAEGRERQIARLPGAWVAYHIRNPEGFLAPTGAVSVGGLLAIPSHSGEQAERAMHWEIYDLHLPDAEPIVIPGITTDVELIGLTPYFSEGGRPSVFWGPGELLAIPWDELVPNNNNDSHITFVEGRTGAAASVDVRDQDGVFVLPYWAIDGSGVIVGDASHGTGDVDPSGVLHPDGTVTDIVPFANVTCGGVDNDELPELGNTRYVCRAPDASMLVVNMEIGGFGVTAVAPMARLAAQGSDVEFDIAGSFAGWLEVEP